MSDKKQKRKILLSTHCEKVKELERCLNEANTSLHDYESRYENMANQNARLAESIEKQDEQIGIERQLNKALLSQNGNLTARAEKLKKILDFTLSL